MMCGEESGPVLASFEIEGCVKTVISALHFAWQDMGDCIERATRQLGVDGVELSWHASFRRPHCTVDDLETLASMRGQHDCMLSAHIWNNLAESTASTAQQDLKKWLHLCRRTGVQELIIHGGSYANHEEGIARTRHVLERVLPDFEQRQVRLNLENHYAYEYRNCRELFSQPWEFKEVFNLDSPSLQFCLDTGHANMTRNTGQLLDELSPWLNYVHLADNHGVDDDHVPYGQGTVAWQEVFTQLRRIDFHGTYCIEFPVREDKSPFDACVEHIRKGSMGCPTRASPVVLPAPGSA